MQATGWARLRAGAVGAALLLACTATLAETSREFWPEFNAFLKINERARWFLQASGTHGQPDDGSSDRVSSATEVQIGAHLDYALTPVLRAQLRELDWARNRYLWTRVGYQRLQSASGAPPESQFQENRGILEMTARTPPLAGELEWIGRAHWDWRNRNGQNSSMYRLRLGVERSFDVGGHVVVPYVTAETIYDTRHSSWSQQRYQLGAEVAINATWRVEPYLEARNYQQSQPSQVLALGLVLKYFR
jgi:hypothetical protein